MDIIQTSWPNVVCADDRATYVDDERLSLCAVDIHPDELKTAAAAGAMIERAEPPYDPDEAEQ